MLEMVFKLMKMCFTNGFAGQTDTFNIRTTFDLFGEEDAFGQSFRRVTIGHESDSIIDDWFVEWVRIYEIGDMHQTSKKKPAVWYEAKMQKWLGHYSSTKEDIRSQHTLKVKRKETVEQTNEGTWKYWQTKKEFSKYGAIETPGAGSRLKMKCAPESTFKPDAASVAAANIKKQKAEEKVQAEAKKKREEETENKKMAAKAHLKWVERKAEEAKANAKRELKRQQKKETLQNALETTRKMVRERRGCEHKAWLETKQQEDNRIKQEKDRKEIMKHTQQRIKAQANHDALVAWKTKKASKDKKATKRRGRKADREVGEAVALNHRIKKPTYFCPVPRGPSLGGGDVRTTRDVPLSEAWLQPEYYTREAVWEREYGSSG